MIKTYYDVCAEIYRHNRQSQDDMELKRIVKTVTWWNIVCMSDFGVIVFDTANVYSEVVHQSEVDDIPDALFTNLSHQIIFNEIDRPASQIRRVLNRHSPGSTGTSTSPKNILAFTPSKNKLKIVINTLLQVVANIKGCRMKLTKFCRDCTD